MMQLKAVLQIGMASAFALIHLHCSYFSNELIAKK